MIHNLLKDERKDGSYYNDYGHGIRCNWIAEEKLQKYINDGFYIYIEE